MSLDAALPVNAAEVDASEPVASIRADILREAFDIVAVALFRFLMVRVGNRDTAEDLLQQTCLEAIRHKRPPDTRAECIAWMMGIAKNVVRRHWRACGRTGRVLHADSGLAGRLADILEAGEAPDRQLISEESTTELLLTITELEPEDQALIFGFYFERRSQAELAQEHGGTEKSVESRLYRARGRLRKLLRHGEG